MRSALVALIVLLALGSAGYFWQDEAEAWVTSYLDPSQEEPVPTLRLETRPYEVRVPAHGELTGLETTPMLAPRIRGSSLKLAWIVEEGSIVDEGDLLVRFDNTDAQIALEQNRNTVSSFSRQIEQSDSDAKTQEEILKLDRHEADLELDYAQRQIRRDETIFSLQEIQESVVSAALAEFKKENIESKGTIRRRVSQADKQILQIQRDNAESEVEIAQEVLNSLELRAPSQGVAIHSRRGFSRLEVGSQVWGGMPLLELAALYKFQAELQVLETEVSGIEPGAQVELRIAAFPDRVFQGEVRQLAKAPQQVDRQDPRKYFTCHVLLEDVPLELMRQMKTGMRVEGEIRLQQTEDAIILPKSAVIKKDKDFLVFVQQGQDFQERQIEILESDHGFYLVKGVEEGEVVALRHPFEDQKLHLPDFSAPARSSSQRFIMIM
ncbi:MAG TPA: efflux RND transporter periplasmic adaptor subunit [Acidobacteriota bacterium]|nr:efflux RND transporter periplasmic adaptor subunit [Acidobacteriota bacterium]